jgi:hypothetical protein
MTVSEAKLLVGAIVLAAVGYAGYLGYHYRKIRLDLEKNAAINVVPSVAGDEVSEAGYIFSMRRETNLQRGDWNLVWFIVVPSTNMRYSVPYWYGYQDFKTGQVVNLIHVKDGIDPDKSSSREYIVGLYDKAKGKCAQVGIADLEELMMEDTSE